MVSIEYLAKSVGYGFLLGLVIFSVLYGILLLLGNAYPHPAPVATPSSAGYESDATHASSSVPEVSGELHYSGNNNTFYITSPADDVYISGNDNVAYYAGDVPVRHIFLSGNYNTLYIKDVNSPLVVKVSGNGNVVYAPRSPNLTVINVGNDCQVIYSS